MSVTAPVTDLLVPPAAMATITVDPCFDARWQTLLTRFHGDVFHSPAWMQVLADTYGLETRAHLVLDTVGTPIGGLPFCHIRDMLGDRFVTLPFSDYCDPLAMTDDDWKMLTSAHLEHDCPVAIRCLHNDLPLDDARFELVKRARWHGLDLRPDLDRLWRGFHPSTHRAVRKSQRDGVVVRIAQTRQELRTFYEMHLATRKYKYRMLAQPYCFLENIWRHFVEQGSGVLLLARYADRIVAGVMFLRWKDTMYYKFNASASADLEHRPNDQLMWEGIKLAKESGCTSLDFGLSDWDQDGLIGYKRKFASIEKAISFLGHSSARPTGSDASQTRALLTALTELFVSRSVPDDVTERASENLYRYFC